MSTTYFNQDGIKAELTEADLPVDTVTRDLFATLRAAAAGAGFHLHRLAGPLAHSFAVTRHTTTPAGAEDFVASFAYSQATTDGPDVPLDEIRKSDRERLTEALAALRRA
jgi:hypothetical protein